LAVPIAGAFFGGQVLLGVVVAGAFAAILSTMAGLIIACAGTVGHDLAVNVFDPQMPEGRRVSIARAAAVAIGLLGIPLGLVAEDMQIAVLVGLAFAVAASTFFPVLVLGVWWPKMTCGGAIAGLATGLVGSLTTILGRVFLPEWLQFRNPGGLVMFLAFGAILLFSWLERTARGESAVPNDTEEVMIRMHGPEAG
ncbi:MAG: cation acetate symporter, partial [Deltaproteobacteria bacterium]|nr:cation acetate symporter [Deltaproteobacteria bacterium]